MEIEEVGNLTKLFISPISKLMDEFNGSGKEFKHYSRYQKQTYKLETYTNRYAIHPRVNLI